MLFYIGYRIGNKVQRPTYQYLAANTPIWVSCTTDVSRNLTRCYIFACVVVYDIGPYCYQNKESVIHSILWYGTVCDQLHDESYWDDLCYTEYNIHLNKTYSPNKDLTFLKQHHQQRHTEVHNISIALSIIIDEYILLYTTQRQSTHHNNIKMNIFKNFWSFLSTDTYVTECKYFKTLLSSTSQTSPKYLAMMLFVKLKSIFRKNSAIFKFDQSKSLHGHS